MSKQSLQQTWRRAEQNAKLGMMAMAMPAAIWTTLAHRLPLFSTAVADPASMTNPEFGRMVAEKVKAGGDAMPALARSAAQSQQALSDYAATQWQANVNASLQLMGKDPLGAVNSLSTHGTQSVQRFANLMQRLSDIGVRGASGTLRPSHNKVIANAKRLSR